MSNWNKYKLGEVIDLKRGYDLPQQNRKSGKIPIYSSSGLSGFHNESKAKGPGVITGRYGTLGELFYSECDYWPHNTTLYVKDFKSNLPKFIYYFLQTLGFNNQNDKTSVPGLNRNHLHEMNVSIPEDIQTQSRIASILSSFDDKIELNRRMNQTLEQMAQALFNHYFVDNIDPDNLPEGWRMGKVEDLFILQRGFDLPASQRTHGRFQVIAASGLNGYHETAMVKGPGITTGRSGVIGNIFYIIEDFWPLNTSLYIKEFKVSTPLHAFYVLKQLDLKSLNGGSAVPTLNRNHVHSLEIIIPANKKIIEFQIKVEAIFQLKRNNEQQSNTLAKLRDTLLPKLISGEIDLDEINNEDDVIKKYEAIETIQ